MEERTGSEPQRIDRRALIARGLKGAGGAALAAGALGAWVTPAVATVRAGGQAQPSPKPTDDVDPREITRGSDEGVLAFTGGDLLAALLAAGAALGAGGATHYASRKRKKKRSYHGNHRSASGAASQAEEETS